MKELVIFYSYGGSTRKIATALAQERGAELVEVKQRKRPSIIGAFLRCPAAIKQRPDKNMEPITVDMTAYDKITIMGPIWAGHPAPPVNNIIEMLPQGAQVEVRMVSGGGSSNKENVVAKIERQGAKVTEYVDIKTGN